jgi:hypothetical protein
MFVLPGGRAAVDVAFTREAFVAGEHCSPCRSGLTYEVGENWHRRKLVDLPHVARRRG